MKRKVLSVIIALLLAFTLFSVVSYAQNVDLSVTVRDFNADGVLFEGNITTVEGLVMDILGEDKKPVYNLPAWRESFGEDITLDNLKAFFNDVPGVNMTTTKTLTLRPCQEDEYEGYWEIDSSIDENGDYLDGYFPIDNELFGNLYTLGEETYDDGHNYHFSVEIHTKFKYVKNGQFLFSGDDDVWVFFNNMLVIDLGGVHGEESAEISLDEIAPALGINVGDIVDFDMFYMERHTSGSNMKILTNFDFLNLQASDWAQAELAEADKLGLIPANLLTADLTQPITRAEFAAVSVKAYEALSGEKAVPAASNPFTDTNDSEILKAYNLGITTGTSATTFEPDLLLNREQAATMLARVFKKVMIVGWEISRDAEYADLFIGQFVMPEPFADDEYISDWAKPSVYFMAANGIINGIGDNLFAPKATTDAEAAIGYAQATREQALAIATRMVKKFR